MEASLGRGSSVAMAEPKDIAPADVVSPATTSEERAQRHKEELIDIAGDLGKDAKVVAWDSGINAILTREPLQEAESRVQSYLHTSSENKIPKNKVRKPHDFRPPTPHERRVELKEVATKINRPVQHSFPDGTKVTIQPKLTK